MTHHETEYERRVVLVFAKYAWYIGATYNPLTKELFLFPLPCVGVTIRLKPRELPPRQQVGESLDGPEYETTEQYRKRLRVMGLNY